MKKIKRLKILTASVAVTLSTLVTTSSCSDDPTAEARQLCEAVVTFTGNHDGNAWFEYRAIDDSPLITLKARGSINQQDVGPGTRLLMRYSIPTGDLPSSGGQVNVFSLQRILTDTVSLTDAAPAALYPLYLTTIQRSGEYLDLRIRMATTNGRKVTLSADTQSIADGIADVYLSATVPEDPTAYNSTAVASLWIGPLWNRPDVNGIRLHLSNTNNIYRNEFTFLHQTNNQ